VLRLPKRQDEPKKIDFEASLRLFRRARELGVNYFDTAYLYDGGDSERCLGQFLKEVEREKVVVSTNVSEMPGGGVGAPGDGLH